MNSIRCQECGFVNFVTEMSCRRCGQFLAVNSPQKSSSKKINYQIGRRFSFFPFVLLGLILSFAAFFVYEVRMSFEEQGAIRQQEFERELRKEEESIRAKQEHDRIQQEKFNEFSEKMKRDFEINQEMKRKTMERVGEDLKKENEKNGIYKQHKQN